MIKEALFPDEVILKTENFIVSQDCEVPIPGFFILSSKKDIKSIAELTHNEMNEFSNIIFKLRIGMKEVLNIGEVYIFQNEDSEHNFHVWLFPRYEWMEKFGKKIESVKLIMNYAKENMNNSQTKELVKLNINKMKDYFSYN